MVEQNQLRYWLAALHLRGVGPQTFKRWLDRVDEIKTLFHASDNTLKTIGLNDKNIDAIRSVNWSAIEKELAWCDKHHCHIITIQDTRYPRLLAEIHAAPSVLFVRGDVEALSQPQLAMVGSRHPSPMGSETAESFSRYFAKSGFVVTSGMAIGIDGACHRGALQEGKTVAVLGAGLAQIYPVAHLALAEEIVAKGAIVSEFPPYMMPKAVNFPLRNRLISGLSIGVLVVEAALHSGSLITARYALEQGREVFAIPGSIHQPLAKGCHHLIREGAKLVETAEDVVEEIGGYLDLFRQQIMTDTREVFSSYLDEKQKHLLSTVGFEPTGLDTIIARSGLTAGEVSSILLSLELEGYVQTVIGGYSRVVQK